MVEECENTLNCFMESFIGFHSGKKLLSAVMVEVSDLKAQFGEREV